MPIKCTEALVLIILPYSQTRSAPLDGNHLHREQAPLIRSPQVSGNEQTSDFHLDVSNAKSHVSLTYAHSRVLYQLVLSRLPYRM